MIPFRELVAALRDLGVDQSRPVIAHASLSSFGGVQGGADTVLGALLYLYNNLIMPTFTYKTMLVPENGPPDNGIEYGRRHDTNQMAEFFHQWMPADPLMGVIPEALRRHPKSLRSKHPILSFAGVGADTILESQSLTEPLAPVRLVHEAQGWVLLLGVNHTVNTSIHFAERLAGRKQFIRWALTPEGVIECPGFPGCSDGFDVIAPRLGQFVRTVKIGQASVQATPLVDLTQSVMELITEQPLALLCNRSYCGRCDAVRKEVERSAVD